MPSASFDSDLLNDDVFHRAIAIARLDAANPAHDIHPVHHFPEDGVAAVEGGRRRQRDEELAAIGVRTAVGHREDARLVLAQIRMKLVRKGIAGSANPLAERIAALDHESVDDAMED